MSTENQTESGALCSCPNGPGARHMWGPMECPPRTESGAMALAEQIRDKMLIWNAGRAVGFHLPALASIIAEHDAARERVLIESVIAREHETEKSRIEGCPKCGSQTPIGHRCIVDDLDAIRDADLSGHPLTQAIKNAAPKSEPQAESGDVAVATVLDPASGSRMFYFDKADERVLFGDIRDETHILCDGRALEVHPQQVMDFRDLPFPDGSFRVVVFDPPHLIRAGQKSWSFLKYGRLEATWQEDLTAGFAECFRVLAPEGVLIFKWNEDQIPVSQILALTPHKPLIGHRSGRHSKTHWITFLKVSTSTAGGGS